MRILGLLVLALFILPSSSHAGRLSFVGLANNSEPKEPGMEYRGVSALGVGALLEFRFLPLVGVELGALQIPRKFQYSTTIPVASVTTHEVKVYEFPALLRFHLGHLLSFGIGGYYARATGNVSVTTEIGGSKSTVNKNFSELGKTDTDYGLVSSLALTFRLMALTRLLFDGRYTAGLKNNSTAAGGDTKFNDMQLLAGIQFGF